VLQSLSVSSSVVNGETSDLETHIPKILNEEHLNEVIISQELFQIFMKK